MKVAFIADPLAGFKTYKDSTFAMMEAAAARGHQLFAAGLPDLFAREGRVYLRATPLTLTSQRDDWYRCGTPQDTDLTAFDAVVMRKDPPFDAEYLYATHLMSVAERLGARCFNRGQAIRDHNEKLAILGYPHLTATTLVSRDMDRLRAFVSEQGDAILKPLDSMGGEGIFRLSARDPNLGSVLEVMSQHGQRSLMVQRYLPQITDGDKRILLIDGKPVDYCLARIPKAGETRGNLAAGGRGEARPLSARDREIAEELGPKLAAQGLLLVGLDVIGDCLTEINVTSPTCFREIMDQTGCDVASRFVEALEARCNA